MPIKPIADGHQKKSMFSMLEKVQKRILSCSKGLVSTAQDSFEAVCIVQAQHSRVRTGWSGWGKSMVRPKKKRQARRGDRFALCEPRQPRQCRLRVWEGSICCEPEGGGGRSGLDNGGGAAADVEAESPAEENPAADDDVGDGG